VTTAGVGWIFGIALAFVWLATSSAEAQVRWRAEGECPSEEQVRAEVARLLGGVIPDEAPAVDARVERAANAWRLRLRVGAESERRLEAASCALLAEATALIVALAIDPVRVVEATETTTEPSEPPAETSVELLAERPVEPPVEADDVSPSLALASPRGGVPGEALVRPEEPDAVERTRAVEPPVERVNGRDVETEPETEPEIAPRGPTLEGLGVAAVGGLELGGLPLASALFGLELRVPVGSFVVEVGAHVGIPREVTSSSDDALGARLGLGLVRVALARPFAFGPIRLAPRAIVELGVTGGRGFGVSDPARGLTAWAAVGLGVALDLPVARRGRIGVVADALVPLWRPGFVVEPAGELHRAAPVVGRVSLRAGLCWR
jgi:hypothetical protein